MKNIKITDIALLALLGGGLYLVYKEFAKPPIPQQVPGGPSYNDLLSQGNSPNKAQTILAWIQFLVSSGMNVYQAIAQANANANAGQKPPSNSGGGGGGSDGDTSTIGANGQCWYDINKYRNLCDDLSATNCHNVI